MSFCVFYGGLLGKRLFVLASRAKRGKRPGGGVIMSDKKKKTLELKASQRKYLKGLAHRLKPVVQVGQDGVTEGVLGAVDAALLTHELIKVRLEEPEDKKGDAQALAQGTQSFFCSLVGHTVTLYRPNPEEPRICLP